MHSVILKCVILWCLCAWSWVCEDLDWFSEINNLVISVQVPEGWSLQSQHNKNYSTPCIFVSKINWFQSISSYCFAANYLDRDIRIANMDKLIILFRSSTIFCVFGRGVTLFVTVLLACQRTWLFRKRSQIPEVLWTRVSRVSRVSRQNRTEMEPEAQREKTVCYTLN